MQSKQQIIIIGTTGLVGRELLSILVNCDFDQTRITVTASDQSVGSVIDVEESAFVLKQLQASLFNENALVFQCASNEAAIQWVPMALGSGSTVIDCSSTYRSDPSVPLVIPCVNGELLDNEPQLIASPNCTTIILLTAINGLCKTYGVESISVATYQAVSGAGRDGLEALLQESAGKVSAPDGVFPEPSAFNVFCHESSIDPETGFNGEEARVIAESRRILGNQSLPLAVTCMRVPVKRVHTEAITLTLFGNHTVEEVLQTLRVTENVVLLNDEGHFPTALKASGGDFVLVGHVRVQHESDQTILSLVACGDQLRTGAALNAVRIAESLTTIRAY